MPAEPLQATSAGSNTWELLPFNIIKTTELFLVKMQIPEPQINQKLSASLGILHFTSFPDDYDMH